MSSNHNKGKEDNPKSQREEAVRALEVMRQIEAKHKKKMKCVTLKDGAIVSSTNTERLKAYKELDKKTLKIGY